MSATIFFVSLVGAAVAAVLVYGGIACAIARLKQVALAKPNQRSSHVVPTPQGAGIVIVPVALSVGGVALALSASPPPGGAAYLLAVAAATLALTIVGFLDDMRGLGVAFRLAAQALAAVLAVALMPGDMRVFPSLVPLAIERLLLIAALLWFINLFNFMDGIDLISVAETATITLGIAILAASSAIPSPFGSIALALFGAMMGFAPWNAPPARLFLGDAGSLPLGFLLGVLLIHAAASNALAAAVILPLYYLADATITLLRRLARGERVWEAHRQHFYQQATRNGFAVKEIALRIAALGAGLIALAAASTLDGQITAAIALLVAAAAVALTLRSFAHPRH